MDASIIMNKTLVDDESDEKSPLLNFRPQTQLTKQIPNEEDKKSVISCTSSNTRGLDNRTNDGRKSPFRLREVVLSTAPRHLEQTKD